jgi:hypothetical protein
MKTCVASKNDNTLTPLSVPQDLAWPFNTDAAVLGDRLARGVPTAVMLVI